MKIMKSVQQMSRGDMERIFHFAARVYIYHESQDSIATAAQLVMTLVENTIGTMPCRPDNDDGKKYQIRNIT